MIAVTATATVKPGVRALGITESYRDRHTESTLAGAVVRASRVVDGLAFASCTVGGMDATDAVCSLFTGLEREDVRYVLLGAVAPAWYNLLDLERLHAATDLPTIAVTFEASDGLEPALREAFSGEHLETRLDRYRALPPRRPLSVNDETVYVRNVGIEPERADAVVRAFTPDGGRPEPTRVARVVARAADRFRDEWSRG